MPAGDPRGRCGRYCAGTMLLTPALGKALKESETQKSVNKLLIVW